MRLLLRLLNSVWAMVVFFAICGYLQIILRTDTTIGGKALTIAILSVFFCYARWEYRCFHRDILEKIAEKDDLVLTPTEKRELVEESTQIFLRSGLHPEKFKK